MLQLAVPFAEKDYAKTQVERGKLRWNPPDHPQGFWYFDGEESELPATLRRFLPAKAAAQKQLHVLSLPFEMQKTAGLFDAVWNPRWRVTYWRGNKEDLPEIFQGYEPKPFSYEAYVEQILNKLPAERLAAKKPFTLRKDQIEGVAEIGRTFNAGVPVFLLGDDVGLGKTVTTWAAVLKHFSTPTKIAIVAPPDIHPGWRSTIEAMGNGGHTVVILNYERLRNLYDESEVYDQKKAKKIGRKRNLKRIANNAEPKDFTLYIWDESHYLKNLEAARTKLGVGLYREGTYHIWLSATAGQNPLELAYILPLLQAKTNGDFHMEPPAPEDFEKWYQSEGIRVKRGAFGKWQVGATEEERKEDCARVAQILWEPNNQGIRAAIRRLPSDIAGWPEIQRIPHAVELNPAELKQYNKDWEIFLQEFREEQRRRNIAGDANGAVALLRFRMKASLLRARHTADLADDLIENGHQVAISCEWHGTIDEIAKELEKRKIKYVKITGKETGPSREAARRQYQLGEVNVVIFNVKEGINLHQGELRENDLPRAQIDHDIRWSAIAMHQIDGRSHRNGKFARIYWSFAEGTREADVAFCLLEKLKSMKTMLGEQDIKMEELEAAFTQPIKQAA